MNADPNMVHNLVSDKGAFQSPLLRTDQSWSRKFDKPGVYAYHCVPHPWMKGTIVVK
jgi:plastocyanin